VSFRGLARWRLGKLGAAIVFVAGIGVASYLLFFRGGTEPDPSQDAIRAYYESRIGGSVPSDVANRLQVELCEFTPLEENGGIAIVRCDVSVGKRAYSPCFGFEVARIVSGPYQIDRTGCDKLVYDPGTRDFVLG
jgi:hypothetical protein